ncbi:hypothetical protein DPEC_G00203820 [Dallia pectoralis]|uniref:Uncharacterized protein n=1 Tax=Dallia pectoralis TaxID=75939 RepID=A0ACC2G9S7_DALPE|nr:hypothetical protein DPEC_G00203820 [Dallia pectoralis]
MEGEVKQHGGQRPHLSLARCWNWSTGIHPTKYIRSLRAPGPMVRLGGPRVITPIVLRRVQSSVVTGTAGDAGLRFLADGEAARQIPTPVSYFNSQRVTVGNLDTTSVPDR